MQKQLNKALPGIKGQQCLTSIFPLAKEKCEKESSKKLPFFMFSNHHWSKSQFPAQCLHKVNVYVTTSTAFSHPLRYTIASIGWYAQAPSLYHQEEEIKAHYYPWHYRLTHHCSILGCHG
ncbi:Transmembrane O-methyltransferase [Platysternon megacephalum]|uniref:Transmembrane O-methyltransferase n=1 Tax=Platysternon megacephalum TaxID=55544 RepID=A0A4D9DLE6_9SAUR|nr:Transmembrane O-methyltransferase [Platysternon megacephalum]